MPGRHIRLQHRMAASTGAVWAVYADFPNLASHDTANQPSRSVPFKQAASSLVLEPDGDGAVVRFDYRYVPRGGPIGRVTGPVIDRMLTATFKDMLAATERAATADR